MRTTVYQTDADQI